MFHEEQYIRMLLRTKGLILKRLTPGTFLQASEQQWEVSIGWEGQYFTWNAWSMTSGLSFSGEQQHLELIHGHGARKEGDRLLSVITSQIPHAQILDYSDLEEQVLTGLRDRGYSKSSPVCELRIIEQSETLFRYGAFLTNGSQTKPIISYSIEITEPVNTDALLEEISIGLIEGDMSAYNIKNMEAFIVELADWARENVPEIDVCSDEQTD